MCPVRKLVCVSILLLTAMVSPAASQTLWLASEWDGEAKVHCYLTDVQNRTEWMNQVSATQVWRTNERRKCDPVILRKGGDSFSFSDRDEGDGSTYWLSHDFGVSTVKGKPERSLLHAKAHTSADPSTWRYVSKHRGLPVEIVPNRENLNHRFIVLVAGWPLAKATVDIIGPDSFHQSGHTNADGAVTFDLPQSGLYGLRVSSVHTEEGELNGRSFAQTVHVSTLTLPLEVMPDMRRKDYELVAASSIEFP